MKEKKMKENLLEDLLDIKPKIEDLRLSFSRVSSFIQDGPKTLLERRKINNQGILMGGLIDLLLFEKEKFKDEYYVLQSNPPTATLLKLANEFLEYYNESDNKDFLISLLERNEYDDHVILLDALMVIVKNCGFWSNIKDLDKIISKFDIDEFYHYILDTIRSTNKKIITNDDLDQAHQIVSILKSHKHSKYIFDNEDNYYQFEINFEYNNFKFLSYLDIVSIDHKNKTIKIIDLKTGAGYISEFKKSFLKYNYHIQAVLYLIAGEQIKKDMQLEEYELLPFEFLYISRFEKVPMVFVVPDIWIEAAVSGYETKSGFKNKGLLDYLDDIKFHLKTGIYDISRDIYESKGVLSIESDYISIL